MKNGSIFLRLLVLTVALVLLIIIGSAADLFDLEELFENTINGETILKLVVMVLAVITFETLLVFLLKLPSPKNHRIRSILSILASLLKYVAAIVILCFGLAILGVNVSTIVASVGIVALVVGFSAESLIADVVTGAFMIFENHYNVGDIIEVDGFRGTVTDIGIRTTCLTDTGENVKIINNSAMKNILNRSDKKSICISDVGVAYKTDLEGLEEELPKLLETIKQNHSDVFETAPEYLGVQSLSESAVVLRFKAYVNEDNIYKGARILNHDLFIGFKKMGIVIPFPQVDVHMEK